MGVGIEPGRRVPLPSLVTSRKNMKYPACTIDVLRTVFHLLVALEHPTLTERPRLTESRSASTRKTRTLMKEYYIESTYTLPHSVKGTGLRLLL